MTCFNADRLKKFDFTLENLRHYVNNHSIKIHSMSLSTTIRQNKPWARIVSNCIGNQLSIYLPFNYSETFKNKEMQKQLVREIIKQIQYGYELGIKHFTFLATTPSLTNYGRDVIEELKVVNNALLNSIVITTSHATTLACMTVNTQFVLKHTNRNIRNEIIGVLGCGSIGYGSILTLISTLNKTEYPNKILLCDTKKKLNRVIQLKNDLQNIFKYNGNNIDIIISKKETTNDLFYESTLILGATNRANVLNPDKLRRGCIIVDDSAPHCFDEVKAWKRFKNQKDIFFVEGGFVQIPEDWTIDIFSSINNPKVVEYLTQLPGNKVFSCRLGGMLLHRFPNEVKPILGPVKYIDGIQRLKLFRKIGIKGCAFHCGRSKELYGKILPHQSFQQFIDATASKQLSKL
eukprot:171511_1